MIGGSIDRSSIGIALLALKLRDTVSLVCIGMTDEFAAALCE